MPTDTGHWELYGPLIEGDGQGANYNGSIGAEINYGAAPGVQITLGLPVAFSRDTGGTRWGSGDIATSVKYRFYHDEKAGISIAAFPGMTIPTARRDLGNGRVTAFLPIWVQKDMGRWSLFGGGGLSINPGRGNRDYWTGGVGLSCQFTPKLLVGVETDRQGADAIGGHGVTNIGIGFIRQIAGPFRLLASGGPNLSDGSKAAGFHGFLALGLNL